ncbi:hypothetical protein TWF173_008248 [Orbilia oligospora]|uniref:Uncharacterized protein n=1 Tax=Orbilia oligospora TaxID=2813651 RepID=A0A7C8RCH0_ORBOL|nr:hypothetical protein TWF970_002183 [Orbilia oligospora]KAF3311627.1 hypothetical protein TWF173_008248 [Orbilia oligospora]
MFPAAHSMAPYTNLNPISRLILVFRIDSRGPGSIAFQKAVKSLRWSRVLKREQREDVVWTRFVDVGGRRRLIFQIPYWAKQDRTGSHPARMPGTRSISSERPFG